jgi:hypothetical protein
VISGSHYPSAPAHRVEDHALERLGGIEHKVAALPLAAKLGESSNVGLAVFMVEREQIPRGTDVER